MSSHSDSYGQRQAIAASAAIRKISMGFRSMPNSPRMMPKHSQSHLYRAPTSPAAAAIAASAASHSNGDILSALKCNGLPKEQQKASPQQHFNNFGNQNNSWNFAALTDHLNVQQVNNYNQQSGFPEINWQERCLELQLELHRSKNQSERIRGMLRDKVRGLLVLFTDLDSANEKFGSIAWAILKNWYFRATNQKRWRQKSFSFFHK